MGEKKKSEKYMCVNTCGNGICGNGMCGDGICGNGLAGNGCELEETNFERFFQNAIEDIRQTRSM